MGNIILGIFMLLAMIHFLFRLSIIRTDRKETLGEGKIVRLFSRIILEIIGIISYIVLFTALSFEGFSIKFLGLLYVIVALGYQAVMDRSFIKGSLRNIISLTILVLGIAFVCFFV